MVRKRNSFGSARYWMKGHKLTMQRYLNEYYPVYDWDLIKNFLWDNPIQAKVILEDYCKSDELKFREITMLFISGKSKLIYIVGARGSGKTATAFYIAEYVHYETNRPIYYIAPSVNQKVLPQWIKFITSIGDAPNGCLAMVDETAIQYNAREFMKESHRDLTKLLVIARHKEMSIIFLTQHTALSDKNLTRLRDIIIWKKSNDYQMSEQSGKSVKENLFWQKVRNMMSPRTKSECLFEFPAMKRFIHFKHELPECWSNELSKSWQDAQVTSQAEKEGENKANKEKDWTDDI